MSKAKVGSDDYYIQKIQEIIRKYNGCHLPGTPTKLSDHVYIGNYRDAEVANATYLKQLGITHVLNCAAFRQTDENPYPPYSDIVGYLQFRADDIDSYDMLQHFTEARTFIDGARAQGGNCLVHCAMGINRSGAICAAYFMVDQNKDLLAVIRNMKGKRGTVICNRGFQKQLIHFARQRGLLKPPDD